MTDYSFDTLGSAESAPAEEPCDGRLSDAAIPMSRRRGPDGAALRDDLLAELLVAVSAPDEDGACRRRVLSEMRTAGLSDAEIADHYIPEIARRVGQGWVCGSHSVVDVTIVTAGLQSLLRELGARQRQDPVASALAPCVAVVVLADEAHTLGAMVFCNQLRRIGISVRQIVGQTESAIVDQIIRDDVDAVMISVARTDGVASLTRLVKKLRRATTRRLPIVVGGAVVALEENLKKKTGVDHIATDPRDALKACGTAFSRVGPGMRAEPA